MTSKNVQYYIKLYENVFDNEFCKETLDQLKDADWEKHTWYKPETESREVIKNDGTYVSFERIPNSFKIEKQLNELFYDYIFNHLASCTEWFRIISAFSNTRYNRYKRNATMRMHCDHIHDLFSGTARGVPILSVVGSLNNDYKGGKFIMWGDTEIPITAGSLLIFPSNLLFPHTVTKVTQGTRYSWVNWAW